MPAELIGNVSENTYLGKPLRIFNGIYKTIDERGIRTGRFTSEEVSVPVQLAIHPNQSRRIIVNVPGYDGVIDGFADKYKILGHHIQSEGLAAFVRTGNHLSPGYPVDAHLNAALQYVEKRAWEICGEPNPEIMLMGFSAGASAIAARASKHPNVSTIALFAPSGDMYKEMVREGLERFTGDVYIVVGEQDDVVGTEAGQFFYDLAAGARKRELYMLPDCDHQFRGEANGRIISEAPFYAFSKDNRPLFPDSNGGIKLYE